MARPTSRSDTVIERYFQAYGHAPVLVVLKDRHWEAKRDEPAGMDCFLDKLPEAAGPAAAAPSGPAARDGRGRQPREPAPRPVYFPGLGIEWGYVDPAGYRALAKHDGVEDVYDAATVTLPHPVQVSRPLEAADVAADAALPHLRLINVEPLWKKNLTGEGVAVGHLDTGVDGQHPAFDGRIADFVEVAFDGSLKEPAAEPHDSGKHGTHTAATICGGTVGGVQLGVAPKARLYSAVVIEGGNTLLRVLSGMQWMLQKGVKVINLSLGVPGYTPFFEAVMRRLRADGVLVVCAIGNEGPHTCRSPGNYEQVVSVGAAADAKRVAAFSGSITFRDYVRPFAPDVLAPGEGIVSALAGGGLVRMDGTSMATALVTGLAALLKQADRDASPQRIEGAMKLSCQRLDGEAIWRQGFGLIDGERAYQAMQ